MRTKFSGTDVERVCQLLTKETASRLIVLRDTGEDVPTGWCRPTVPVDHGLVDFDWTELTPFGLAVLEKYEQEIRT